MLPEISLNILDVAQNSIRAEAQVISITVDVNQDRDDLVITIEDDGCGMTVEQIEKVIDPFFTTRTTRKIGLGVPFFRMAALATGGDFSIKSEVGVGTVVTALFKLSHIDRMPLGDINSTIHTLIIYNTTFDFVYTYRFNDNEFTLDTRQMREILGNVPFDEPEISAYIKEFLDENKKETDGGVIV